jgi:uncharacterized delta-60 repeat protein
MRLISSILLTLGYSVAVSASSYDIESVSFPIVGGLSGWPVVKCFAEQNDDGILVGGYFHWFHPFVRQNMTRLSVEGAVDTNYSPVFADSASSIYSIAIESDGAVLAGGSFSRVNGVSTGPLVRLRPDGQLATNLLPVTLGGRSSSMIRSVARQKDRILIAGLFESVDGRPKRGFARLNTDGSLDSSFTVTFNENIADGYPTFGYHAVVLQNDEFYVAGGYQIPESPYFRAVLQRYHVDGNADGSFSLGVTNGLILRIAVQTDGRLVAAYNQTFDGTPSVRRFNTDGSVDTSFNSKVSGSAESLLIMSDGKILVGGSISAGAYPDETLRRNLIRLNANGSLDPSFSAFEADPNGPVNALLRLRDGRILVGGRFTQIGGQDQRCIALLSGESFRLTGGNGAIKLFASTSGTYAIEVSRNLRDWQLITTVDVKAGDWVSAPMPHQSNNYSFFRGSRPAPHGILFNSVPKF